ncbi:MAG: DUF502 domain-containing protein [Bacteroidota bacterium]
MKKLVTYFVQGLLVFSPFIFTVFIITKAFNMVDDPANEIINIIFGRYYKGLGFLLILITITFLGFLSSTIIFRGIFKGIENIILRNSLIRMIYTSIKDLSNAFMGEKKKFNKPVLVQMDKHNGIYKLGFITQKSMDLIAEKDLIAVYLPISYSIAGDLYLVEKELIKPININSSEAMKFIVSGGVTHIDIKPNNEDE